MPDYVTPGVYIDDLGRPPAITARATDIAGFVGVAEALPDTGPPDGAITSATDFARHWSTAPLLADAMPNRLWPAVRGFFDNGGRRLHVATLTPAEAVAGGHAAAVDRLADTDAAIIAAPDAQALLPVALADAAMRALVALADVPGSNRLAVIDAPRDLSIADLRAWRAAWDSRAAALYWPWLRTVEGTELPPSAFVAGAIARTDNERGVWKAPANVPLAGVTAVTAITAATQDLINPDGINAIRAFPGRGLLVWGARTLSRDPEWTHVPVRRLAAMIDASIGEGLGWVAFEPNGPALWARVHDAVHSFLHGLWRQGALAGDRPEAAFFVRGDSSTMTPNDIAAGHLVITLGHAPLRPAEFIVLRLSLTNAA